jgi:hypothetical protein
MKALLTQMNVNIGYVPEPSVPWDQYLDIKRVPDYAEVDLSLRVDASHFSRQKVLDWVNYVPEQAIVKCQHCGQWCARYTACVHCGAPVD